MLPSWPSTPVPVTIPHEDFQRRLSISLRSCVCYAPWCSFFTLNRSPLLAIQLLPSSMISGAPCPYARCSLDAYRMRPSAYLACAIYLLATAVIAAPTNLKGQDLGVRSLCKTCVSSITFFGWSRFDTPLELVDLPRFVELRYPSLLPKWSIPLTTGNDRSLNECKPC